jgi:hypothetical protein
MLGRKLEDLLGKNMFELFSGELAWEMVLHDKQILESGEKVQVDEVLNDCYYTTIKIPHTGGWGTPLSFRVNHRHYRSESGKKCTPK